MVIRSTSFQRLPYVLLKSRSGFEGKAAGGPPMRKWPGASGATPSVARVSRGAKGLLLRTAEAL